MIAVRQGELVVDPNRVGQLFADATFVLAVPSRAPQCRLALSAHHAFREIKTTDVFLLKVKGPVDVLPDVHGRVAVALSKGIDQPVVVATVAEFPLLYVAPPQEIVKAPLHGHDDAFQGRIVL